MEDGPGPGVWRHKDGNALARTGRLVRRVAAILSCWRFLTDTDQDQIARERGQ
jgi:hypothetical protein